MKIDTSADSSFLINFLRINRLDLLNASPYIFHVTDHVEKEISEYHPQQKNLLYLAIDQGVLHKISDATREELTTFAELHEGRQLGGGVNFSPID